MTKDEPIIFVLDDDERVREALSSLLSSLGFCVEVFASAREYLGFQRPDSPACLILDLDLPGMSGLDLQQKIAREDSPPTIFVTGHGELQHYALALQAGAM